MSEAQNPSEPESANEASEGSPKPANKRSKWMMIAAIAIVLILIGSAAAVLFWPKNDTTGPVVDLKATIGPNPFVVEAGASSNVSCYAMDGTQNISTSTSVAYKWSVDMTVGELLLKAKQKVSMNAVKEGANGTIKCTVTYKGKSVTATATVKVNPPFLESIQMSPPTLKMGHFKSQNISATAVSSVGTVLPVTNFTWSVSGMAAGEYELWGQWRSWVHFNSTAVDRDPVMVNASGKYGTVTKVGTATINVTNIVAPRSVVYRWYDMFNVPFGGWWNDRLDGETPYTTSYPYILKYDLGAGNIWYYMNPRLNVTARNITEINTNDRNADPFLPHWGVATGGNIVIDWYMNYLTKAEVQANYASVAASYDGWYILLSGTVLLDEQSAMGVLGINHDQFVSFGTWWAANKNTVSTNWQSWFNTESSDQHYWIMPAYSTDMMQMAISMDAVKIGDKVQLYLADLSWGVETLMTRWLKATFMPTEWYFEDFKMHMEIGPETSNVDIDTVIVYGMFALETNNIAPGQTQGQPCWVWQAMEQDYLSTTTHVEIPSAEHNLNEFQAYSTKNYLNRHIGSMWYGQWVPYDYTPGVFNLKAGETLTFEWPAGDVKFLVGTGIGTFAVIQDKINVSWAEPTAKDQANITSGGSIDSDLANYTLTYKGPIDFYNWSKTQTSDAYLSSEWDRLNPVTRNLIPYGSPWIEFRANSPPPPVAWSLKVEGIESPIVTGDSTATVKVAVYDQYGLPYPEYNGTVHFSSSGPATGLPADYTFVPATDHGVHNFTGIALTGSGDYWINVTDTVEASVNGTMQVFVIPEEEHVDHFAITGVPANINVGDAVGATVTAYDQFGLVYWRYNGTVTFTTNATLGTYSLSANYTFTSGDRGVHRFAPVVTFNSVGIYDLVVADTANLSAVGTKLGLEIKVSPEITYTMYDMFEPHWREWWWQRSAYEIDLVLNNTPHHYTMIYTRDLNGLYGYAYAPYRWNTVARNMTTLNANSPEYMPIMGPVGTPNARVNMTVHFDYINNTWYNNSWYPKWRNNSDWQTSYNTSIRDYMYKDGYVVGTEYTVVMNREAAVAWLNLSLSESDVAAWWTAHKSAYDLAWTNWISNEGNSRLDIYCGYDDLYYPMGTMSDLVELPSGELQLSIGHFSWGYEVLMMRWNTEDRINVHETYMEDYTLVANYTTGKTDVTFDGICQWSLKAVVANGTVNGSAWAWEPMKIDYVTATGHHSDWAPYETLFYTDWNALDPNYGSGLGPTSYSAAYENCPTYFNLTSYQKFVIVMPKGNQVIGYKGEATWVDTATYTQSSITNGTLGDLSDFDRLTILGEMTLGYYKSGGVDIASMYDAVNKTIVMQGPLNFDNFHHWPGGPLYHGAPWIEFNVTASGTPGAPHTNSLPAAPAPASAPAGVAASAVETFVAAAVAIGCLVGLGCLLVVSRRRPEL